MKVGKGEYIPFYLERTNKAGKTKLMNSRLLIYFTFDPNKKGRGRGYYYHRGKGYWSKFKPSLDNKRKAKRQFNEGDPRKAHLGDGTYKHIAKLFGKKRITPTYFEKKSI